MGLESEEAEMIKIGIIGSTGYAGGELARLLLQRDDVEIKWYGSKSYVDQKYASIYQNMFQIVDDTCMDCRKSTGNRSPMQDWLPTRAVIPPAPRFPSILW